MAKNREGVHPTHFASDLSRSDEHCNLRNEIESILEAKVAMFC